MYKPLHFKAYELVDRITYMKYGDKSLRYMDDGLMKLLECLRMDLGPLVVNDWYWNGDYEWSGLRTPESPWYSRYSGHSYGKALDIKSKEHSVEYIHQYINDNWKEISRYTGVKGIRLEHPSATTTDNEYGGWVHIDVLWDTEGVYTFHP